MHAKDGQEGEAMRPDCRQSHMSRWGGDDQGRVEASERSMKVIHQVYCVQSTRGLSLDSWHCHGPMDRAGKEESRPQQFVQVTEVASSLCNSAHTLCQPVASSET